MVRTPCCDKETVKKGTWSAEEDDVLTSYIDSHGSIKNWIALPQKIGLNRCGKSCRLRWLNYLRPHIKHGEFTEEEDKIITEIYLSMGSRWSIMADKLPGRTDNDIKNYWNTNLKRKIIGNKKKTHKKPSFRGLNGGMRVENHPPVFTITNGHLMSTTWPSNTEVHNQQEFDGCSLMGGVSEHSPPIILNFSTNNTTTAACTSGEGGVWTGFNPPNLPKHKTIKDYQPMVDQFFFPSTTSSGGGATTSLTISDPPMNNIIKDRQSTTCHFCFREDGSNTSSSDLMKTSNGMHDTGINMYMDMNTNIDTNVDVGSSCTLPEAPSTTLRELQDLLFEDSPTPNTATGNPFQFDVIDSPGDFLRYNFENLGSWNDDAAITSLISSLPICMDDNNNNADLPSNSCNYEEDFLPQDVLDQFS